MPAGRPTSYDPSYCATAVDILSQGYSETVLAGELDVCPATIANWKIAHPEFLEAVKRGRAKGVRVWEDRLATVAREGGGNATAVIFGLKNRASEDWRDKTETEHSGGVEIKTIQRTLVDPRNPDS
jgi:hypothetical protein